MGSLAAPSRPIANGGKIRNCLIVNDPPLRSIHSREDPVEPALGFGIEPHQCLQIYISADLGDFLFEAGVFVDVFEHLLADMMGRSEQITMLTPDIDFGLRQVERVG